MKLSTFFKWLFPRQPGDAVLLNDKKRIPLNRRTFASKIIPAFQVHADKTFINKHCFYLSEFIISEEINEYDLKRLAWLNHIALDIPHGWYNLLRELVIELHQAGWNKTLMGVHQENGRLDVNTKETGFDEILYNYSIKSFSVCEECGGKATLRDSGLLNVACRKHYLEGRDKINLINNGFTIGNETYYWTNVASITFDNSVDEFGLYRYLSITLNQLTTATRNSITISSSSIGWGSFLNELPTKNLADLAYIHSHFAKTTGCKVCGYMAIYNYKCECCEQLVWNDKNRTHYTNEHEYYKGLQLEWYYDDGDEWEAFLANYEKDADYVKLVTQEDLIAYEREIIE